MQLLQPLGLRQVSSVGLPAGQEQQPQPESQPDKYARMHNRQQLTSLHPST